MVRKPLPGAILTAALAVVAACSDSNGLGDSPVAVHDGSWNGDDAALVGTLVEEDGCVLVLADEQTGAGARFLLAFAEDGLEWDEHNAVVTIYGEDYQVGEEVRIGGSGWPEAMPTDIDWLQPPSTACRYDAIWGVTP